MTRPRAGVKAATKSLAVVMVFVVAAAAGVLLLATKAGGGAAPGASGFPTFYSTSSTTYPELRVGLNSSTMRAGSALTVQAALYDAVYRDQSVDPGNASDPTIASWNAYDFLCGSNPYWSLAGYALFQGDYVAGNLSSVGEPLMLAPPIGLPCHEETPPSHLVFLPDSSDANAEFAAENGTSTVVHFAVDLATEACRTGPNGDTDCPLGASLFGYWSAPAQGTSLEPSQATTSSEYFHRFSPGAYTLVIEDVWGQAVYAHFQVSS
jgi:hypothetical protein